MEPTFDDVSGEVRSAGHPGQEIDKMPISRVREGMEVFDADGDKIGTVAIIRMGDPDAVTVAGQETPHTESGIVTDIASAFGGKEEPNVPEALRARMIHDGYIKVDGGLLGKDRYARSDQIAGLAGDAVRLNVAKDELVTEGDAL